MAPLKVVLMSASRSWGPKGIVGGKSLALKTIQAGLMQGQKDRRIKVSLFPSHYYASPRDPNFKIELDSVIDGGKKVIFGLSTTTQDYANFQDLASFLREKYSTATIVAGGAHFRRESVVRNLVRLKDPIEVALEEGLADAVVVGHAQPFLDFVNNGGKFDGFSRPGFYHRGNGGRISGSGYGTYPRLDDIPYIFEDEEKRVAEVLVNDTCANGCGYCSINKGSLGFSREVIERSLRQLLGIERVIEVNFMDSNPFEPKPGVLLNSLEKIRLDTPFKYKFGFIDPSLLLDPGGTELALRLFKLGFISFFIGRDVVTEEDARIIGAKYRGTVKSQQQLDAEKKAIKRFIANLSRELTRERKTRSYPLIPFRITFSYIVSPFATPESEVAEDQDQRDLYGLSDDNVKIAPFQRLILKPYPGTEVRRKFINYVASPGRFDTFDELGSCWDSEKLSKEGFGAVERFRQWKASYTNSKG
jgi:hypothetical protein